MNLKMRISTVFNRHVALSLQSFFFQYLSINKATYTHYPGQFFLCTICVFNVFNTHTTGKDKLKNYEWGILTLWGQTWHVFFFKVHRRFRARPRLLMQRGSNASACCLSNESLVPSFKCYYIQALEIMNKSNKILLSE